MYDSYKIFLLEKIREETIQEIILIILFFFLFFVLFSIFYNIFIYFKNKYYLKKLLNYEKQHLFLKSSLNSGNIDTKTYRRRVIILNKKIEKIMK